jgi:protein involved in polysaccharide export with SLBB domain
LNQKGLKENVLRMTKVSIRGGLMFSMLALIVSPASSQSLSKYTSDLLNLSQSGQKGEVRLPERSLLDREVDPNQYVVGPGDVLQLNLLGELNYSYQITVTPEGTAIIPSIGSVAVSGLTLKETKDKIVSKVLTRYRGVDVTVTLIGLREFMVSVVGQVGKPGMYPAKASQRAVALIFESGGILSNASKRNIQIKRRDGNILWVDLEKFERAGDYKRNPYLQEGDVIFVPVRQNEVGRVGIYGAVRQPGEFEFCPGDSLYDLIELGQGLRDDAWLEEAEIIRFGPEENKTVTLKLNLSDLYATNPGPHNLALQAEDRIFVHFKPSPYPQAEATILGLVKVPGSYPIVEGKTKLTELVNLAGGFAAGASLAEAQIYRTSLTDIPDSVFFRLIQASPGSLKPDEFAYLKSRQSGVPGRVSVDFVSLFEQNVLTQDRLLRDGDSIYIPPPSMVVNVAGQVVRSGFVPYSEGASAGQYVNLAGGYSGKADKGKIYLVKRGSGEWTRLGGKQKIEPGDAIWVPMKGDKSFWNTFKDIVLTVGSIATTYFVIDQATQ